jgi:cytosine/uracil/thiamine/allantoin permease
MKKPDTIIAKFYFLFLIGLLIFFFFSIMMWILNLSGKCGINKPKEEKEKKKKSKTFIYLLIFVLVCSMAAQAVNQSYTRIVK